MYILIVYYVGLLIASIYLIFVNIFIVKKVVTWNIFIELMFDQFRQSRCYENLFDVYRHGIWVIK